MELIDIIEILVWPFFVFLLAVVFFVIFWKPISRKIEKLSRVKASTSGFEASTSDEKESGEKAQKKEEQAVEIIHSEEEKIADTTKETDEPKNLEEWRNEMFLRFVLEKDLKKAQEAFEEIKKLNQESVSRKKDEITYLRWSHTLGDTKAIPALLEFLKDEETVFEANLALGFCYSISEDYSNTKRYFDLALSSAKTEADRVSSASRLGQAHYYDGDKEKAIQVVVDVLSNISESENKIVLFETLAKIYEKEKDFQNRAFVLDKASELRPGDTNLLFSAAYSYSQCNFDELSLLHYNKVRYIDPKNDTVLNNLGVNYEELKMPIKSIASYKESEKLGNTLASANLAYRLFDAGFMKEAKEILDLAKEKDEVHTNVNEALAKIVTRTKVEDDVEKEKKSEARKLRSFFIGYVDAKFTKSVELQSISGDWNFEDGSFCQLDVVENTISGLWKRGSIGSEHEWKLEGKIFNDSAEITFYGKEYILLIGESDFKNKGEGFLYYDENAGLIHILEIEEDSNKKLLHTLSKKK